MLLAGKRTKKFGTKIDRTVNRQLTLTDEVIKNSAAILLLVSML